MLLLRGKKMIYEKIMKTNYFKNTYKKIEELKKDFPVNHGFVHINNVVENSKHLAKVFELSQDETQLLLVSAVLHDVGYVISRDLHPEYGAELASEFLRNNNILNDSQIQIVSNAIKNHSGKSIDDFQDKISTCLILADKMDFISKRYSDDIKTFPSVIPFLTIEKTYFEKTNSNCQILNFS